MKNKILSILFIIIIYVFMIGSILIPKSEVSKLERRKLAEFPSFQIESVFNGDFFEDLNQYLLDHFPLRNIFISIKGIFSNFIFQNKQEDGVFIKDGIIYELNTSLDKKTINHFTDLIHTIHEDYFFENNVYYAVIPDKNYYLNASIPKLDYDELKNTLNNRLANIEYIDLFNVLSLDSYYKTDIHWRQEKLESVLRKIESSMNLEKSDIPKDQKIYSNFYGGLYGRIANKLNGDQLIYLENKMIETAKVFDYEKQSYRKVYEESDLKNIDSYDIYLGGAKSLLIVENKDVVNGKELVLFRDSFGSSIAPLLLANYSKIILIDLRYFSSKMLPQIEELFTSNQDVLFLYSVPIINQSFTLK